MNIKKSILLIILLVSCVFTISNAQSEKKKHTIEIEIRKLDSLHAVAVLSGDLKEMD